MEELNYYNLEAEESVIGIALAYPEAVRKVASLDPIIFYGAENRVLITGIRALHEAKSQVDLITMSDWLTKNGKQDEGSWATRMMQCVNRCIGPGFLDGHVRIIRQCFSKRQQRVIAREYARKLDDGEDPDETREWMVRQLREVKASEKPNLIGMKEAVMRTYEQMEANQQKEGEPEKRILSGISTMDNKLGGLTGAMYVAIGARPSVGKSIFALTYALNAAKQGKRVLMISLEMNEVQITQRILANRAMVSMSEITGSNISSDSWVKMAGVLQPLADLPLWFVTDSSAGTVDRIKRAAYALYEDSGIDMLVVDYIQLIKGKKNRTSRQEEVGDISRELRLLAAELNIPILVLSQLNRNSAKGRDSNGKRVRQEPTMSDARESGSIEQDANIFMLLHDPDESEMRTEEEKEMYRAQKAAGHTVMRIIIDKNRNGKKGRITLAFDGDHMRFLPITKEQEMPF